jgi:rhodanese-related sulfurtransferase
MLSFLKKIIGAEAPVDYKELMRRGAQIVDVRTEGEFNSGHIKAAVNIPLNSLSSRLSRLKMDQPVITCCASGLRSAQAKNILRRVGFDEVYNGGGWTSLNAKLS